MVGGTELRTAGQGGGASLSPHAAGREGPFTRIAQSEVHTIHILHTGMECQIAVYSVTYWDIWHALMAKTAVYKSSRFNELHNSHVHSQSASNNYACYHFS